MSLNRLALIALLLTPLAAEAKSFVCPPPPEGGGALVNVRLFDGPVSEQAELVPDHTAGATWNVAGYDARGSHLILLCEYHDGIRREVDIAAPVSRCLVRNTPPMSGWCE